MTLISLEPIDIEDKTFLGIHVKLPKTDLLVVANEVGYIMCGALDVGLLNERLADRNIIAGRAVGVRSLDDLLNAPLQKITEASKEFGWTEGMTGKDALLKIAK
mgnify:CR=1 FL=1